MGRSAIAVPVSASSHLRLILAGWLLSRASGRADEGAGADEAAARGDGNGVHVRRPPRVPRRRRRVGEAAVVDLTQLLRRGGRRRARLDDGGPEEEDLDLDLDLFATPRAQLLRLFDASSGGGGTMSMPDAGAAPAPSPRPSPRGTPRTTSVAPTTLPATVGSTAPSPGGSPFPSSAPSAAPTANVPPPSSPAPSPAPGSATDPPSPPSPPWAQVGHDINGPACCGPDFDHPAQSVVSLSSDGTRLAVGTPDPTDRASSAAGTGFRGLVRVYQLLEEDPSPRWVQLGGDVRGPSPYDGFGSALDLSGDGTVLAVGSTRGSGNMRVFSLDADSNSWVQLGQTIIGEADRDGFGGSVALSSDGRTVAAGAPQNRDGGVSSGHVRAFAFDGAASVWAQLGANINGDSWGQETGASVSLSADGTVLAVGASQVDAARGRVRVYGYSRDGAGSWQQRGQDLLGEAERDYAGAYTSVSLSSDGSAVAVGGYQNGGGGPRAGHLRVYALEEGGAWVQRGADLDGRAAGDHFGTSVSLSGSGDAVAVGAPSMTGKGGYVQVFVYQGGSWKMRASILGENEGDEFGFSVSLSAEGTTVAAGRSLSGGYTSVGSGQVRVFKAQDAY